MYKRINKFLIFAFLIVIITGCSCDRKQYSKAIKYKKSELRADQKVDGIDMINTDLIVIDGISHFTVQVKNNTSNDYELEEYEIIFYDETGKKITTIPGYIGEVIKAGEFKIINSTTEIDLSKAARIKYKVIK